MGLRRASVFYCFAIMAVLLLPSTTSAQCPCNTSANYAILMDFYTNSTGWINSSGWGDPSVPICDWYNGRYIRAR